jgi:ribosomal protein S18 acetylase RimI-like enzyme
MIPSIERIEKSGFAAWSPDETATIAGWTVASSGGFTRRLNSASSIGPADTSLGSRDEIAAWLAERGAGMTVRWTPLMDAGVAAACMNTWGLAALDDTNVMVRETPLASEHGDVTAVPADDPAYTADLMHLNMRHPALRSSWDRIVARTGSSAVGLWVPGRAVGFTVVCDGISSVFSVAVRDDCRRTGLATRIMSASAAWAFDQGAEWQFVQVLGTNKAAIELYEGLGFSERYRYRYLEPTGEQ